MKTVGNTREAMPPCPKIGASIWIAVLNALCGGCFTIVAGTAWADNKEVPYAPEPSWIAPAPTPTAQTPSDTAVHVVYSDNQIFMGTQGMELYQAFRIRIQKPEALPAGNLSVARVTATRCEDARVSSSSQHTNMTLNIWDDRIPLVHF